MKFKTSTVTGKEGANLRVLPSSDSQLAKHLDKGAKVEVVLDFSVVNDGGGTSTKYICIKDGNHFYWAAEKNFDGKEESAKPAKKVDYCARVVKAAKAIYPKCIGMVHSGKNNDKVVSLATMLKYKVLSCHRIVSIVLQEAGLLDVGEMIFHTAKRDGKKAIADAIKGWKQLKHCKVKWVNKTFAKLPDEYKQPGCIYIQNSNACIYVGNNHIFSCNKSKLYKYKSKHDYDRTSGYPFSSKILVVIVPDK